ncbi:MAG: hypothetical protein D6B27_04855 [Gammaproteobacteria bacterium]|nr:MAG: hypothetical protein D6B27_04855 [Gammaproteobacteria bacterium]
MISRKTAQIILITTSVILASCVTQPEKTTKKDAAVKNEAQATVEVKIEKEELSPDLLFQYLSAELSLQRGEKDYAVDAYDWIIEITDDVRLIERAIYLGISAGRLDTAEKGIDKILRIAPETPNVYYYLARLDLIDKKIKKAAGNIKKFIRYSKEKHIEDSRIYRSVSALISRKGSIEEERMVVSNIYAAYPQDLEVINLYARVLFGSGNYKEAKEIALKAIVLDRDNEESHSYLISSAKRSDKNVKELDEIEKLLGKYPGSKSLHKSYLVLLIFNGKYRQAEKEFKSIVDKNTDDGFEIAEAVALYYIEKGLILDFIDKTLKRIVADGSDWQKEKINYKLAMIAEKRGSYKDAVNYYEKIKSRDNYWEAQYRAAVAEADDNKIDAAIHRLEKLKERFPAISERIDLLKIDLLKNHQKYHRAIALLNQLIENDKDNFTLRYTRAMLADNINDVELAESDLRYIIKRKPDSADALNALGYILTDKTNRYSEAEPLIMKAYKLMPESAAIIDSIGWLKYKQGKIKEAELYLKKALRSRFDPEIAIHMIKLLQKQNKIAEAKELLNKAKKEFPENKKLTGIKIP